LARIVFAQSRAEVTVPSGESIVVFCQESARVGQKSDNVTTPIGTVTAGQQTFGPFLANAVIVLEAEDHSIIYGVGVSPFIRELVGHKIQRTPAAINAAGAIPLFALFDGVINASAGLLGITGTLPTGAIIDSAGDFRMDDSFDWHVISTGLGTFTLGGSAGHTVVGSPGVGSGTSGVFRTRKTGTANFVSYRIG